MKKIIIISTLCILSLFGCVSEQTTNQNEPANQNNQKKIEIVTSFYPLYEIANEVGKEKVNVVNLVPAGAEPHDFEPTPKDIIILNKADIVLINGGGFEPWVERIAPELESKGIKIVDQSKLFTSQLLPATEENHEEESAHGKEEKENSAEDENHEKSAFDPHFWLNPNLYNEQINAIKNEIIAKDPENKSLYEKNAAEYEQKIENLAFAFQNGLQNCEKNTIITTHNAFGYLAKEYNLNVLPIAGISPEGEPSAKTIVELTETMKKNNMQYVFTEPLISPKIAQTLADETGAEVLTLNPIEGLTAEELNQGQNYISIMEKNLENLKIALNCQ